MAFELDHIFICTEVGAPAAQRLINFGIHEGTSRIHPGQGTANRCFFFQNTMLELLWVHEPKEAQSPLTQPTRLWERWRDSKESNPSVCPFGVALRPTQPEFQAFPFPGWDYKPTYLPDALSIWIGNNCDELHEPMLFYLPFGQRPDQRKPQLTLSHPAGFREVTSLRIHCPCNSSFSSSLNAVIQMGILEIAQYDSSESGRTSYQFMEIGFDGETQGRSVNFFPSLPLIFNW